MKSVKIIGRKNNAVGSTKCPNICMVIVIPLLKLHYLYNLKSFHFLFIKSTFRNMQSIYLSRIYIFLQFDWSFNKSNHRQFCINFHAAQSNDRERIMYLYGTKNWKLYLKPVQTNANVLAYYTIYQ